MDSQILRLFIISLIVTLSFCVKSPGTQLVSFLDQEIPGFPDATVITTPTYVNFTGFPGHAQIEIQAASSIVVCITPYAAVTSNLNSQCPNPINFFYNSASPMNEFLLFLDDFSMNFLGQENAAIKRDMIKDVSLSPYSPQTANVALLQNIPYYISIGLYEDDQQNSTLRTIDFTLTAPYEACTAPNQVPNINYAGVLGPVPDRCKVLQSQLTPNTTSGDSLKVSSVKPFLFSFEITTLTLTAQLDFHISSEKFNFTIYFGFQYAPTPSNYDFKFSNSSDGVVLEDFLGEIFQSFSVVIPNPKTGTYYAQVTSAFAVETTFNIEFNTTSCTLTSDQCGTLTLVNNVQSSAMSVQNVSITNDIQYLAISGSNAVFGIDTGSASTIFVQLDINAFPSGINNSSPFEYTVSTLSLNIAGSDNDENFVFGLISSAIPNNVAQDEVTALVWTGAACPQNCSSQGSCNTQTGACTCGSSFTGRYCQVSIPTSPENHKKKLSTLYIILIIIGGAIVLAILIGVPVALFLNNRKKARYERV